MRGWKDPGDFDQSIHFSMKCFAVKSKIHLFAVTLVPTSQFQKKEVFHTSFLFLYSVKVHKKCNRIIASAQEVNASRIRNMHTPSFAPQSTEYSDQSKVKAR